MATSLDSEPTRLDSQSSSTAPADTTTSTSMPSTDENAASPAAGSTEKPARPPKAAKRPSTSASVVRDDADALAPVEGEPAVLGAPVIVAGSTAAGEAGSDEAGTARATSDQATSATPTRRSVDARDDDKAGTTVSTQADSTETADSKAAATTSPTTPSPRTATSPASPPPPPQASTSSSKPTPRLNATAAKSTTEAKTTKKKRKGPFAFLLACVPCIADPGHDDKRERPKPPPQSRPAAATPTVAPPPKLQEKVVQPETAQSSNDSSNNEKAASPTPVEPEAAITPPETEPLVAASPDTPIAAPPPSSSPSPRGVTLPQEETEGVTSGAVVPPGQAAPLTSPPAVAPKSRRRKSGKHPRATGTEGIITSVPEPGARQGGIVLAGSGDSISSDEGSEEEDEEDDLDEEEEEEEDEEQSLIARGGVGIPIGEDGLPHPLLDELSEDLKGRKCLVLDLDETLVHSSFKMVHQADYVVPVEIENQFHNVYVIKRPGVDGFLKAMGEIYEVVVFTASLSKYADPVLDQLDIHRVVKHRLFRESCYNNKGNYVKDLSQLGRPMEDSIIIDNSPASYVFHPNNAVPISSWFNDPHDTELTDLVPFLTDLSTVDDVRSVLDAGLYQHLAQQQQQQQSDDVFKQI
ncbi:hypothetical protein JCM10212_006584 [Sporobolomyces blumeae]